MKKLLLILVILFVFSCAPKVIVPDGPTQIQGSMKNIGTFFYTQHQMDSMCIADTLPTLDNWQYIENIDFESREKISLYFYIKQYVDLNKELLYRAEKKENNYKLIKRLTE